MKISILLCAFSLAALVTCSAGENTGDARNIEGTWLPVKAELAGKLMSDASVKSIRYLRLAGGRYEVQAESLDKGDYTIDPAAKPKVIDIKGVEGPNAGKKIPAIYELDGDRLTICYGLDGTQRPTEFKTEKTTMNFLITYRRKKD